MEYLSVQVPEATRLPDFDRKALKPVMREIGREVRKLVRARISKKVVSKPGEPPGKVSGEMARSIKATVSRSGFSVWVRPTKTAKMSVYYPAFVVYGHRGPGTRTEADERDRKKTVGEKVAEPRENFIEKVAQSYQPTFEEKMTEALAEALK